MNNSQFFSLQLGITQIFGWTLVSEFFIICYIRHLQNFWYNLRDLSMNLIFVSSVLIDWS